MTEQLEDRYFTIAHPAQYELKVKGSRFIAECKTVVSTDEAQASLVAIRKREHAATHHCYAWRVGLFEDATFKYSDDGEPSGTAGRPIYQALCGQDLTNVLIVVTRYFGGTKLGTGGLSRAYSEAAVTVLEQAGQQENYVMARYRVRIAFSLYDQLLRLLHKHGARQTDAEYSQEAEVEFEVRRTLAETLVKEIVELSQGKADVKKN